MLRYLFRKGLFASASHDEYHREIIQKNHELTEIAMRHQQLIDGVQDYAIYWLDPNGKVESWNSGAERFKGYSREEIIGQNFSRFYSEEDQQNGLPQKALDTAATQGKFEGEGWRVRKDGSKFWANVSISPIHNHQGKLTGFAKVTRDITEQKKFEQQLILSEERYNLAVDGMSVGVWDWNIPTGEIYWSPRLYEIFGIRDANFSANLNYFSEHLHPEDKDITLQKLSDHLAGLGPYNVEYRFRHPDGKYVWIHASGKAKWDENGNPLHMAGSVDDITDRKEIERLKSEFISVISHELRTPISGVIGMNDLLLHTNLDAPQRHYAEMINYSAEALLQIIDDILDVSKIEAGKMTLEIIPFNLRQLCDGIMELEQIRANKKNIKFALSYAADCPENFFGDPVRIRQILFNLCNNAVKFTEVGQVTLNVAAQNITKESADIIFTVTDSGIGIPREKHEIIFNKFDQADASITRRFGGTGLGLPISRQLARLMGGDITLQSSPGRGSVFTLQLTLSRADEIVAEAKPTQKVINFANARVLVAEDNVINQEILSAVLARHGIQSMIVNNGKEAIELLLQYPFDLILMDCQMPEMDGFEATRVIRANATFQSLPIVAMTANAMKGDREKCIAAGMDDFLSKPLKNEKLSEILLCHLSVKQTETKV